jgi:uncharacterized membrane protein YoaK (UPF0700 family)
MLTVVTGLVDAVSYVTLGHVFVANMTGNVVFLGFAVAGASGLSVVSSLIALFAFTIGALAGGRIGAELSAHRGHSLRAAAALSAGMVASAAVIAAVAGADVPSGARYALIATLAVAMGIQNAIARRLVVPDLTTTVLTLTVTGIAADSHAAGGSGGHPERRLLAIAAMLAGAAGGAVLALNVDRVLPLALAASTMAATALAAHVVSRSNAAWTRGPGSTGAARTSLQAGTIAGQGGGKVGP